jgi:hypothetical protein
LIVGYIVSWNGQHHLLYIAETRLRQKRGMVSKLCIRE